MKTGAHHDAIVVGSGPNGLAAAIALAERGFSVQVLEAKHHLGGGARTAELTLPGFHHDICSAVHPLAAASPFFNSLALAGLGVRWIHSPAVLAHPLDDGTAAVLERSLVATAAGLGLDGGSYVRLLQPLVRNEARLIGDILAPLHFPKHPLALARFGLHGLLPATVMARRFKGERARALFAGLAAHSMLPLEASGSAAFGLLMAMLGHAVGWPLIAGGSQNLSDALAARLRALGADLRTDTPVASLSALPKSRVVLLDTSPRQFLDLTRERPPSRYRRRLENFRPGPGVFKIDWALDGPIPWAAPECARAATVHLGGTLEEISRGESEVARGGVPDRPFTLLVQPSLFDPSRAPAHSHTAWAYCHVPNGSAADMSGPIEKQVERFAPGFRERILARRTLSPRQLEDHNPNNVGGDISGGANSLGQLFARPVLKRIPYATDVPGVYLCSASTPPGAGVHGMCGYHAAAAALRRELDQAPRELSS